MVRPAPCWGQTRPLASFQLAILWPNTYCTTHVCGTPIPQVFTIHGMFAMDNYSLPLPWRFEDQRRMNSSERQSLNPLVSLLNTHWPNLENSPNMDFWSNEFAKHASCFNIQPVDYFSQAVFLKIQLDNDMKANLFKSGITPDVRQMANVDPTQAVLLENGVAPDAAIFYHAYQFDGAFPYFLGETVQVKCDNDSQHQNQLLEIYFCITLNWKLMSCNPVKYIDCATTQHSVRFTTVP